MQVLLSAGHAVLLCVACRSNVLLRHPVVGDYHESDRYGAAVRCGTVNGFDGEVGGCLHRVRTAKVYIVLPGHRAIAVCQLNPLPHAIERLCVKPLEVSLGVTLSPPTFRNMFQSALNVVPGVPVAKTLILEPDAATEAGMVKLGPPGVARGTNW